MFRFSPGFGWGAYVGCGADERSTEFHPHLGRAYFSEYFVLQLVRIWNGSGTAMNDGVICSGLQVRSRADEREKIARIKARLLGFAQKL